MGDETAKSIVALLERLISDRGTLDSHCEEIAKRVLPRQSGAFEGGQQRGEKRTTELYDATGALALERFAAAMESMLTPRNSMWHRLRTSNIHLNKDRDVAMWFEDATRVLFRHRYANKANYASQQHENYMALGAFGTGAMFIDELQGSPGFRYRSVHLSGIYFLENHQGLIDTAFRLFKWTAKQAAEKWGAENLPDKMQKALGKNSQEEFEFIHYVAPRKNYDPERIDHRGMPIEALYIAKADKQIMSEGGYHTFPYAISRYVTAPGEVYGRSPGMLVLPALKTINLQKKTILKQGQRITDPVLLAHDDGIVDAFNMRSGYINPGTMTKDGKRLVDVLPTGQLSVGIELMQDERNTINDAFLVTLFQILVDTPAMTATEVLERSREKGALLSPTMGRQQSEALGPQIERELDIASRLGLLRPMPPALIEAEGEYDIEYDSPLSRAQKAEEAGGLFRAIELATTYANVTGDQAPFDWINMDEAMPEVMVINAVPERWKRSKDDVEERREARAEAAQTQQMIDAAPAAAGLAKAAGGA